MKKTKILFFGYSSFLKRRIIPSIKRNDKIEYFICSKSQKRNTKEKVLFNDYLQSLKVVNPDLVYISLINSLHFKYAKILIKKGFNVIVDKPIALMFRQSKELVSLAKKKNLFLAEATLFNYHKVFDRMLNLSSGKKNIKMIQSYFHIPVKYLKNADCEEDMSPYAAAIIRLFTNKKIISLKVHKDYFKNTKSVKSFKILVNFKNCTYFGSFSRAREYKSEIIFFTKNKEINSPKRIFALPYENLKISLKKNNKYSLIKIIKDDQINNFFNIVIKSLKNKRFNFFYNTILEDAKIRKKINQF